MANNKDYNVIDSAVVEIGFKINETDLVDSVKGAMGRVQEHLDKNPLNLNVDATGGAGSGGGAAKKIGDTQGLQFVMGGEANEHLTDAISQYSDAIIEARHITAERFAKDRQLRYEELKHSREKFEFQKQKYEEAGDVSGDLGSVKGVAGLIGGKAAVAALAATGLVSMIVTKSVNEIIARSTEISNKFITGSSAFVDRETRDTMARFGLDPIAAQGMDRSMGLLGMTPQDLTLMTPGQQQAMGELMQQWFDGVQSIGQEDIQVLTDITQEFQMMTSQFKLQWELAKMEILVVNREQIAGLQQQLGSLFESIIDFATHPVMQEAVGILISVVTGIVDAVTILVDALTWLMDQLARLPVIGSRFETNNTVNNTTNNYGVDGGLGDAAGSIRN